MAVLEHTSFCYYTLSMCKDKVKGMNDNQDDFYIYNRTHQEFERIITKFTEGTKNKFIIENHGDKTEINSILDSIDYINQNKVDHIRKTDGILSEMSHSSIFNSTFFEIGEPYKECPEDNLLRSEKDRILFTKIKNGIYFREIPEELGFFKIMSTFKIIIITLDICINLFEEIYNDYEKIKVKSCNDISLELMKKNYLKR